MNRFAFAIVLSTSIAAAGGCDIEHSSTVANERYARLAEPQPGVRMPVAQVIPGRPGVQTLEFDVSGKWPGVIVVGYVYAVPDDARHIDFHGIDAPVAGRIEITPVNARNARPLEVWPSALAGEKTRPLPAGRFTSQRDGDFESGSLYRSGIVREDDRVLGKFLGLIEPPPGTYRLRVDWARPPPALPNGTRPVLVIGYVSPYAK